MFTGAMTTYEYVRSTLIFGLMLGQPAMWGLMLYFDDVSINWQSAPIVTGLVALYLALGVLGTEVWIWWQRRRTG